MTASTGGPAGTSMIMAIGVRSSRTSSPIVAAPVAGRAFRLTAERFDLLPVRIVSRHGEALVRDIEGKVPSHDPEPYHADLITAAVHLSPPYRSETTFPFESYQEAEPSGRGLCRLKPSYGRSP